MSKTEVTMLARRYDLALRCPLYIAFLLFTMVLPSSAQERFGTGAGHDVFKNNIVSTRSDDLTAVTPDNPYSIYGNAENPDDFYISFNLQERQPVEYALVELTGRVLVRGDLGGDVLNQTCRVVCDAVGSGVYIVRLRIGGKYYAEKIWLAR